MTPEQFNQLSTKEDLKKFVTKDHFDKKIDRVFNAVDGIAKRFDSIETEFKMDKIAHNRIQKDIDNNKKGIVQLKGHLGLKIMP